MIHNTIGGKEAFTTNTQGCSINDLNLPSEFTIEYKMYPNSYEYHAFLWIIGTDFSNGYLAGTDSSSNPISIYNRTNGSNSKLTSKTNAYSMFNWNNIKITVQNNTITVEIGSNKIATAKSKTIGNFFGFFNDETNVYVADLRIKPISST